MRLSRGVLAALAGLCVTGCSGGGIETPETVPAGGAVMYKGSPVVGATVTFMAAGAPRAAAGVTNDKGEFQLSTFGANDGAVVGEHSITVVKVAGEAAPAATNPRDMMGRPGTMTDTYRERLGNQGQVAVAQSELPAKYAKVETSGLKETVTAEGPNKFVIQLTD